MSIDFEKAEARKSAKRRRDKVFSPSTKLNLVEHFSTQDFGNAIYAGYWPLEGEMDIRPVLNLLSKTGRKLCLPCTPPIGSPLVFRSWNLEDDLKAGPYNTCEPFEVQVEVTPTFIFVPLLAFTADGRRLGYGGGFYDRTLAKLRSKGDVFACGVAYAGQETADLPTDAYDERLDGVLTEQYFKVFK